MSAAVHVVLVEDNPLDVLVFREALRRRGIEFRLEHYANGKEAAKAIASMTQPPDLFVLDLNVPRIHGLELLRAIRELPAIAPAAVAILTSSPAPADRARAEESGADLYLVKPDGFQEFVNQIGAAVEQLLNRRSSADGAEARFNAHRRRRMRRAPLVPLAPAARRRVSGKARSAGSLL